MFAEGRVNTFRRVMGEEAFGPTLAENDAKWKREFAETEEALRNFGPCLICGEPRENFESFSDLDARIC